MLAVKEASAVPSINRFGRWVLADPGTPWPRSWQELILVPFYLVVLLFGLATTALAAIALVVPVPASPPNTIPAWLDLPALVVGLCGVLYPSRFISVAGLFALWLAALIPQTRDGNPVFLNGAAVSLIGLTGAVVAFFAVWAESERARKKRTRAQTMLVEDNQTRWAAFLAGPLVALRADPPLTLPRTSGTTTVTGLRAVEVSRHFDSALEASINGGFTQWMNYRDSGLSNVLGGLTWATRRGRGWGGGEIELDARGTIRTRTWSTTATPLSWNGTAPIHLT